MAKRGRKQIVDTKTLIKLADRLFYEELCCSARRLTAAELGRYCRSNGLKIGDNTITRNKDVAAHLDSLRKSAPDYKGAATRPIVFVPVDADELISNNRDLEELKRVIIERDQYYKEIADAASIFRNKSFESEKKARCLAKELEEIKQREVEQIHRITELKEINTALDANCRACKAVIDKYVDPAIATELLKKEGLISSSTTTLVKEDVINETIVTASTRIKNPVLQEYIVSKSKKGAKDDKA